MGAEGVSLIIAGFGTLLAGLGFYVTSRRSATSTYTRELEETLKRRSETVIAQEETIRLLRHDLEMADRRIDTLLDRLRKNGA